jgi:hypothetical protein
MRLTETYVSDLEDTLNKIAQAVGCPVHDPDALIRRVKYTAAAAASAFSSIDDESIRRAFERQRSKDPGAAQRSYPRLPDGEYESSLLQYAWDGFREALRKALSLLADVSLPEEQAVQCLISLCIRLDIDAPHVKALAPYDMLIAVVRELSK